MPPSFTRVILWLGLFSVRCFGTGDACVEGEYCDFPTGLGYRRVQPSANQAWDCYIDSADSKLYCWGQLDAWNSSIPETALQTYTLTEIQMPGSWTAIDVVVGGGEATVACVQFQNRRVRCWGDSANNMVRPKGGGGGAGIITSGGDIGGGGAFQENSLVMSYRHWCARMDNRKTVHCWGFQPWIMSQFKTFPERVRAIFVYRQGTFAVLEDNAVYQWGYYGADDVAMPWKGEGGGPSHSYRRWYPEKRVFAIHCIDRYDICFEFVDGTFSCTGRYAHNIDFSAGGALASVATARYWPLITFGKGHGGQKIRTFTSQMEATALCFIMYESDEVGMLRFASVGGDVEILDISPNPGNPIIHSIAVISGVGPEYSLALTLARQDGSWHTWGGEYGPVGNRLPPIQAIAGETGRVPLLQSGSQFTDEACVCEQCPVNHWCRFATQYQCTVCVVAEGDDSECSAVSDTSCAPEGNIA